MEEVGVVVVINIASMGPIILVYTICDSTTPVNPGKQMLSFRSWKKLARANGDQSPMISGTLQC